MSIRPNLLLWILYGACIFLLSRWGLARMGINGPGMDDAYIFFVYARNFAEGHGFVYNAGGEKVEGFSSMLWTLILAATWKVTGSFGWVLAAGCAALCSLCIVIATRAFVHFSMLTGLPLDDEKEIFSISAAWIGAWALASPGFVIWGGVSLMENCLWLLIWSASVFLLLKLVITQQIKVKSLFQFGLLLGLLLLCRPEGSYWTILIIFSLGIGRWILHPDDKGLIRYVLIPGSVCCMMFALLVTFRMAYFGYPFPNTYYAKVSPDRIYNFILGLKYLAKFGMWHFGALLCIPFVLVAFFNGLVAMTSRARTGEAGDPGTTCLGIVGGLLVAGLCVPVLVGGDHFAMFRVMQVTWVWLPMPLFLWLRKSLPEFGHKHGRKGSVALIAAGIFISFLSTEPWVSLSAKSDIAPEFRLVQRDTETGNVLNRMFPGKEKPSIGVVAAGAIAYAYEGMVWDMMGLNYVAMAHSPGEKKGKKNHAAFHPGVFWQNPPEILFPYISNGVSELKEAHQRQQATYKDDPLSDPFKGLRFTPKFLQKYTLGTLDSGEGKLLGAWYRNDFLAKVPPNQFTPALPGIQAPPHSNQGQQNP